MGGRNQSEGGAPGQESGAYSVLAAVFLTLLAVFYAAIAKPLNRLSGATREVSQGNLVTIPPGRKNEIGQLTLFFNHMVANMRRKTREVDNLISWLTESERRYKNLVELSPDAIFVLRGGVIKYINPAGCRTFGAEVDQQLIDRRINIIIHPGSRETVHSLLEEACRSQIPIKPREFQFLTLDQEVIDVEITGTCIEFLDKPAVLCIIRDIAGRKETEKERKMLQDQLAQSQKMESVGRLAGGVAHDFNNMLSVILGNAELLKQDLPSASRFLPGIAEIEKAARHSTDITRQLLAFARRQVIEPEVLNLNNTIESMLKMLARLIGEDIELTWNPGDNLWPVLMDPTQVNQILANLCTNARDAIMGCGRLSLETRNVSVNEEDEIDNSGRMPGEYVLLSVSDNGCGMDEETLAHIFDPFFTTKDTGKGTGLGVAMTYGIVKQNNGCIDVSSRPGEGTTFRIYLPRHKEESAQVGKEDSAASPAGGDETILLVEDEPSILRMTRMMLERRGYSMICAASPVEALDLAEAHPGDIHLLITDVIMPGMNGR